jgi:hypothetical protein
MISPSCCPPRPHEPERPDPPGRSPAAKLPHHVEGHDPLPEVWLEQPLFTELGTCYKGQMKRQAKPKSAPFPDVFYPRRDIVCTDAFSRFLNEYHSNLDYFFFVIQLVANADKGRVIASKTLLKAETDPGKRANYEDSIANPEATLKELQKHSTILSRNLTNGIVNAFQRYFSSIINSAALKCPKMTSSSQTIRVDEVLRFTRHKDLVAFIIDRKINDLSYGGLNEMEKYFDDRLGVQMFHDDRQRDLLRLFVEVRNINVHNGGIVNDLFTSRVGTVGGFPYTKSKTFHVDMDALITLSENAMRGALHIDSVVGAKFGLQRKAHRNWQESKKASKAGCEANAERGDARVGTINDGRDVCREGQPSAT